MAPPSYRCCQFCGELFGSASLPIHEKRCKKRPQFDSPPRSPEIKSRSLLERTPPPPAAPPEGPLVPCRHCGRTFDPSRIETHERVCVAAKEQMAQRLSRSASGSRPQSAGAVRVRTPSPSKWRKQHAEFISAVRSGRDDGTRSTGNLSGRASSLSSTPRRHVVAKPVVASAVPLGNSQQPPPHANGGAAALPPRPPSAGGGRIHVGPPPRPRTPLLTNPSSPHLAGAASSLLARVQSAGRHRAAMVGTSAVVRPGSAGALRPGSAGGGRLRLSAAQRHASEWYEREQAQVKAERSEALVAAVERHMSLSMPPKQLIERASRRASYSGPACNGSSATAAAAAPTPPPPGSNNQLRIHHQSMSQQCGSFYQSSAAARPSRDLRAGYSPSRFAAMGRLPPRAHSGANGMPL